MTLMMSLWMQLYFSGERGKHKWEHSTLPVLKKIGQREGKNDIGLKKKKYHYMQSDVTRPSFSYLAKLKQAMIALRGMAEYIAKLTFLLYDILVEKRFSAEEWHGCHSKKHIHTTIPS